MLTARDAVEDRVEGLDAGADDYLVKPFALAELLARVRALLRRTADEEGEPLRFADLMLDPLSYEVFRGERAIEMTRTEFRLLELFLRHPRQVLTRDVIFDRVWGYDFGPSSNSLEVYVGYLRRKTEAEGEPRLIHTVRGVGYVLREREPGGDARCGASRVDHEEHRRWRLAALAVAPRSAIARHRVRGRGRPGGRPSRRSALSSSSARSWSGSSTVAGGAAGRTSTSSATCPPGRVRPPLGGRRATSR